MSQEKELSKKETEELESKKVSKQEETQEEDDERKGIIPEDMDFRKFIGCGG